MDLSRTIIPKSDQLNFEDVQSVGITAEIKSVRAGNSEQPVWINLVGFDGRPYKPSKSMRRVLIGGWGSDGHSWVGKSLTLIGDPTVKFGGVAVGGIKIQAMSHVEGDFSMMLSVSRGKRAEHRVRKLDLSKTTSDRSPDEILADFTAQAADCQSVDELKTIYTTAWNALSQHPELRQKVVEVYQARGPELKRVKEDTN